MSNKILIIHDRFKFRGGAERLVLIMAQALGADIATEYWNEEESFSKSEAPAKVIILGKQIKPIGLSYFFAQWRFFWKTKFIRHYDIIIFSGNNCLSAAWRARSPLLSPPLGRRRKLIMYCHTPVRYAYDLKNYYQQKKTLWQRPLFWFFVILARIIYRWGIKKMDLVLANSKNVQTRLKDYCGIESQVVYPPIVSFRHSERGTSEESLDLSLRSASLHSAQDDKRTEDYYLSFGRLDPLKRVDDIIRAFHLMPDKKLVVASGGPDLKKIKQLAAGYENIKVLGFISDEMLAELVNNCIANVYIPRQEDFGMTPLEAAAAGKPTIGVDEGGLRETIIHKQTGYLLPADYQIEDLVKAVQWLDAEKAASMADACRAQAEKFSKEKFIEQIRRFCG